MSVRRHVNPWRRCGTGILATAAVSAAAAVLASLAPSGLAVSHAAEEQAASRTLPVEKSLVVTTPLKSESGYTWTLASRMGRMLAEAEDEFGPRDPAYTPLGVEFEQTGPRVWYPGSRKHVIIQLGTDCLTQPDRAMYQLAHEVVHLIAPTGGEHANNLEEGLATDFAVRFMQREFKQDWAPRPPEKGEKPKNTSERYGAAREAAAALLAFRPDAVRVIREKQPSLSKVTKEQILETCPTCPEDVAEFLVAKF
jgi:hypothetical protein